jgi:hypothetical protein
LIFAEAEKADASHPRIAKRLDMSEMDHLFFFTLFFAAKPSFYRQNYARSCAVAKCHEKAT